jgi:ATP-binding cassette, subfamily B (MDR/TAP), member 1
VVSHRLSTITNCDKIVFINKGVVVEEGTHTELMEKKGFYFDLVNANNSSISAKDKTKTPRLAKKLSRGRSMRSDNSSSEDEADSDDERVEEEEVTEEDKKKVSFAYLMKMNSKEWPYISTGIIASFVVGASFPVFAVLFGEMYGILSDSDPDDVRRQANLYSLLFLVLGLATGIGTYMQTYMFTFAGVRLTSRLRSMTFKSMMSQEMGWFDDPRNAVGALCARLAGDCAGVQGATGTRIGSIVQAASVIVIGMGVSFYYSWKMTLVASITIPLVLSGIVMEARLVEKNNMKEKNAIESATKLAVEAISNIRTVASLGQEVDILKRYINEVDLVHSYCQKKSRFRGFVFGLGQTVPLMGYGLSLWYGGTLVAKREMPYENVIKYNELKFFSRVNCMKIIFYCRVGEALIFGSWMLGQALAYAPNVNTAIISASRLKKLLERIPKMRNPQLTPFNSHDVIGIYKYANELINLPTLFYSFRMGILFTKMCNFDIQHDRQFQY